jgi:stage V sporulation protein AB
LFLYGFSLPLGVVFLGMYGIGAGIFTGCLAAALSEVVNMFPVLSERISLKKGMNGIMTMFAAGKLVGSLFGLLW